MQRSKINTSNPKKYETTLTAILRSGTVVFTGERGVYKVEARIVRKLKDQGIDLKVIDEDAQGKARGDTP